MKSILLIILLTFSIQLFGQTQTRDVVYLKNGSVIKGTITEINPSENLKIKTSDGSLFVYSMSEILKTEKEEFVGNKVNQETSSSFNQSAIDDFFSNYLSKKRQALEYIGASKKNGIKREILGQKVYEIEYELIIESKQDIYINASQFASGWSNRFVDDFSYTLKSGSDWENTMAGAKKKIEKGQRIIANGTLSFEETDNGWRATNFKNSNYSTVASNYVTPEMAERPKKEHALSIKKIKSELDWKKEDIDAVKFNHAYFLTENTPIFSYGHVKYKIEPSSKYKGRNDLASSIQNVFYQAIESTNRQLKSEEESFNNSKNKGNITFKILNISFPFNKTGYQCVISISANVFGEYNDPSLLSFKYNIPFELKSNNYKKHMSKDQAFNSALQDFQTKVRDFIFRYEPIQIEFLRIETNKRGKVDAVILKKTANFISTKRIKFVVLKPKDLTVKNNKFVILGKVGDCVFKGQINGNEIICDVRGGKNKKAFEKYLNSEDKLIALSSY